jgi:hypothetical protein
MIIPIGVDCGVADFCKKYNLRTISFPFDWNVSYNGVSKCIEDDFKSFTPPLFERINKYDIYFHHDFTRETFEEDSKKYTRRYERMMSFLETTEEEVIFCRKGHACHHHYEHNQKYNNIISDIEDAEKLDKILFSKYPHLNYKIITILVCGKCFDPKITYTSNSKKISIYNIVTPYADTMLFENCLRDILKI